MGTWNSDKEYQEYVRVSGMTVTQMLREFHKTYKSKLNADWYKDKELENLRTRLIKEEAKEFLEEDNPVNILKELADLVYVSYGYAVSFGWDLDEAIRRVHISNMTKLDPVTGEPIFREDGKVLKGENYKPPVLDDLIVRSVN